MNKQVEPHNHDLQMQALLDSLPQDGPKPRLLLHACCAPCSSAVLERLAQRLDITLFFYNPNIDTQTEFLRRAEELNRLARQSGLSGEPVILPYTPEAFYQAVKGLEGEAEGGARCEACFKLRLREAAAFAAGNGFDYYTTTLTISPMKNAALLNRLGQAIGHEEGIAFLPSDFKKRGGYLRSTHLSKEYGLYRQDYCGCVFSREARRVDKGGQA
jgi:predicted adenine nucleotide alpha hydrolase (AANH) superfamily ATPase